ncbi:hypothetical protein [Fluviispira multicolorata]|uniref:N-acetyltransferase domain-containing protein n=1 Tax=Fluviispira multicolorata TaxID=2654512 RepID=A0A833N0T5_9BACT|nr:hypothetical protein [Fluviispira multicolorata]KAB8029211.1 hypothetical protein GCL57_11795 [Fluviispira multicolorata]
MQKSEFSYSLLNDLYFNQAVQCITQVFSSHEPMGKHLKITKEELQPFIEQLLMHAFKQKLSWIAIDNSSEKLAAVRIHTDVYDDFEYHPKTEKLKIIFQLLNSLYENHEYLLNAPKNTMSHTWMTAVQPEFQRKGLLKNLYRLCSHNAKLKGFQYCVGEATNVHNLKFLNEEAKCSNFNKIEYKKFKYNESFPFSDIEEHLECTLYYYPLMSYPELNNWL